MSTVLVIANPRSGGGATERRWPEVERRLRDSLGDFDVEWTRAPGDAARIAREGVEAGAERLIVAGGDGTLKEVTTGLLAAGLGFRAEIGVLPLGTGGDFARALGLPRSLPAAVRVLATGKRRSIDAGRVTFPDPDGGESITYFANVASFGVSGLVTEWVNRSSKAWGPRLSFLLGTLRALAAHRCEPVSLRLDGEPIHSGGLVLGAAANGRAFGSGMWIAPQARIDDGLLDVVVVPELSKPALLARLPGLYRGTHIASGHAVHHRGRVLEADAEPGRVPVELDGEPFRALPCRIEVLPSALAIIGPDA